MTANPKMPRDIYVYQDYDGIVGEEFIAYPSRPDRDYSCGGDLNEYTLKSQADALAACLKWYIENDDTNMNQEGNEFYIDGYNRGCAALAAYCPDTGLQCNPVQQDKEWE